MDITEHLSAAFGILESAWEKWMPQRNFLVVRTVSEPAGFDDGVLLPASDYSPCIVQRQTPYYVQQKSTCSNLASLDEILEKGICEV